jgi:hypothetical protein
MTDPTSGDVQMQSAAGVPLPQPGEYSWLGRDNLKLVRKMSAAAQRLQVTIPSVSKSTAYPECLRAMRALKNEKMTGKDKREVVIDIFLRGAAESFRAMFVDTDAFVMFVAKMCDDAYTALGGAVFGRSRCC